MRNLRNYFVMLTVAILAMFGTSCKDSDNEEDLDAFIKYADAKTFYDTYKSYTGKKALIDIRKKEAYDADGGLPESVNFPATAQNTKDNDSEWCQAIKNAYTTDHCLFIYGNTDFTMTTTIGGRTSKIGFGKQNTRVSEKGYSALVGIWGK